MLRVRTSGGHGFVSCPTMLRVLGPCCPSCTWFCCALPAILIKLAIDLLLQGLGNVGTENNGQGNSGLSNNGTGNTGAYNEGLGNSGTSNQVCVLPQNECTCCMSCAGNGWAQRDMVFTDSDGLWHGPCGRAQCASWPGGFAALKRTLLSIGLWELFAGFRQCWPCQPGAGQQRELQQGRGGS